MNKPVSMKWRVHTPNLLQEILSNQGTELLHRPLQILGNMLAEVAERAIQLNDPVLNDLMVRLTLYSVADPQSPAYNKTVCEEVRLKAKTSIRECAHEKKITTKHFK